MKIDVLDHGFVQYIGHLGSDISVCDGARVSFNKVSIPNADGSLSIKDQKLIEYLAKHNHWTPFSHPQITLRVKAPIPIRTQLFKSKVGFSENEISRRYCKDIPEYYTPKWRSSPTDGAKQGSSDFMTGTSILEHHYQNMCEDALEVYQELLSAGVAPEQARFVLPQGMYTEWIWTGSLAAYARVCKLRLDPHAQWEVQMFAKAISEIIQPLFPVSWNALTETPKYEAPQGVI